MTFFITDTGLYMEITCNMRYVVEDYIAINKKMLKNYSKKNDSGDTIYCSAIALFEVMTKLTEYFGAEGWQVDFKVR